MKRIFFISVLIVLASTNNLMSGTFDDCNNACPAGQIEVNNTTNTPVLVEIKSGNQSIAQLAVQAKKTVSVETGSTCSLTDVYVYRVVDKKLLVRASKQISFWGQSTDAKAGSLQCYLKRHGKVTIQESSVGVFQASIERVLDWEGQLRGDLTVY